MAFSIFLPPQTEAGPVPVLYWLSGLTCTEENFMMKAGAQRFAAEHGIAIVAPDTSPRAVGIPGEDDSWDLGTGAGFYVDATNPPWSNHYQMATYVTEELPELIADNFPVIADRTSIFGHSMGGHGAFTIALRNPGRYRAVSALSPICSPSRTPFFEKLLTQYLGGDREAWRQYDTCELLAQTDAAPHLLVDQGTADEFLEDMLQPTLLEKVCREKGHALDLRMREHYDHSYYFVATFIGDHIAYHAKALFE